jgi:8-oxo-dGTP pyrophosphatase MutT (NUDIX family)
MTVQPRVASAVMLLRDIPEEQRAQEIEGSLPLPTNTVEVFMVRRVIQSDFMPDVYVFPGGSVSKDDLAAEQEEGVCTPVAPTAADPEGRTAPGTGVRAAAIRELFEEAGVLLAYASGIMLAINEENMSRFEQYRQAFNQRKGSLIELSHVENLRMATDHLGYFAHWITPDGMPKRFDTHFFITTAPAEQRAVYDRLETSEGIWIRPSEALERYENGTFPLVFATIHQLQSLAEFNSVQDALQYTTMQHVPVRMPVLVQDEGGARVYLPEDTENRWDVPDHMTRSS